MLVHQVHEGLSVLVHQVHESRACRCRPGSACAAGPGC